SRAGETARDPAVSAGPARFIDEYDVVRSEDIEAAAEQSELVSDENDAGEWQSEPRPTSTQQLYRTRAAWALAFAEMRLEGNQRDDPDLRREARQVLCPKGPVLQWKELLEVHRRLRDGLGALRSGRLWTYPVSGTERTLYPGPGGLVGPLFPVMETHSL